MKVTPFVLLGSLIVTADYVPGMRCDQVGGFAAAVVREKSLGDTMQEQIAGMRQSIPNYPKTQHALEAIIRAIYAGGPLNHGTPDDVGNAFERTCGAFGG